ncbi:MAG TPA: type II CAAX endopeptidase family protein [Gemmatimonadaceae bacterium]|nr:type II CAAX endopeptidase family protein [Gemmatimonadaceae bacterium]
MKARDFFYRSSGSLRAPWQWIGFLLIAASVGLLTVVFAAPYALRLLSPEAVSFWSLLAGLLAAHVVMVRLVDRGAWAPIGLARRQASPPRLAVGLVAGSLGILAPSGVLLAAHWLRDTPASAPYSWIHYSASLAAFFLPQSLAEEMLSRGYLFARTREAIGWKGALAITSVGFGLLHMANPGATPLSIVVVIIAGAFLGGILLLTDSLYAAWMAHFAWNWSMAAVLHATVSGLPAHPPGYRMIDQGPTWLTGGVWGPEGGAAAALGMVVCIVALVAWRRRSPHAAPFDRMET